MPVEPTTTALLLLGCGILLVLGVLASRISTVSGIPVLLCFLGVGILAGSEGLGGIHFEDYTLTFRIGTAALVLILFDGGLNTGLVAFRRRLAPASVLATAGVILTAILVALAAMAFGLGTGEAILLGAVVSSTDAAAVLAVLRNSGLSLRRRVGTTLELESGLNDPVAVILTVAATTALAEGQPLGVGLISQVLVQLVVGAVAGFLIGKATTWVLARFSLGSTGLYPVFTLGCAGIAFAVPTLLWGSGFLAVYIAAIIIGNAHLPHSSTVRRVHDALAWFAQVGMFLLLGLLVFPSRLIEAAPIGLALALALVIFARPLAVAACLLPFRFPLKETAFIGWVGLRGAVPILLAAYPVLMGVADTERIFDIVFFIVVVNAILPGSTVAWTTRRLGLEADVPPSPEAILEIDAQHNLPRNLVPFYVRAGSEAAGRPLSELTFPEEVSVALIVRGQDLVTPKGRTDLRPGDHAYLICGQEDLPALRQLFAEPDAVE